MFASLSAFIAVTKAKVTQFAAYVAACIQTGVQRTSDVLAPVLNVAGMVAVAVLSGLAMAQAAQEAEVQAAKARVLADRLLTGDVAVEDIDATVAAYRSYRVHAAAYPCVWDLPSTAELRRRARARSLVRIFLV